MWKFLDWYDFKFPPFHTSKQETNRIGQWNIHVQYIYMSNLHNFLVWTPNCVLSCDNVPLALLLLGEKDPGSSARLKILLSSLRHALTSLSWGVPFPPPISGWARICLLAVLPWTRELWLENATRLAADVSSSDSGTRGMEMEALSCSSRSFSSLSFISRFSS